MAKKITLVAESEDMMSELLFIIKTAVEGGIREADGDNGTLSDDKIESMAKYYAEEAIAEIEDEHIK